MILRLEALHKTFVKAEVPAVKDVSFELKSDETLAVLGPSGCGKSTMLRLAAGLERPDSGRVLLDDRDITKLPPERRGIGLVFQDGALFPHLDVLGNVEYGLVEARIPRQERRERAMSMLKLVKLEGLERRQIGELSGGERQRVALARTLVLNPKVILLDEPLANLDERLRDALRREMSTIFKEFGSAVIFVTHDHREAFSLAERVAIMRKGSFVQVDTPQEVYAKPANAWTARFLGHENLFKANEAAQLGFKIRDSQELLIPQSAIHLSGLDTTAEPTSGQTSHNTGNQEHPTTQHPTTQHPTTQHPITLQATVQEVMFEGAVSRLILKAVGLELSLQTPKPPHLNDQLSISIDLERVLVLEGSSE